MAAPLRDPDANYVPSAERAEMERARDWHRFRNYGVLDAEPEPYVPPVDPCYRCGLGKADHGRVALHAYEAAGESFDGEGDPLTRNDLFGRSPLEQDARRLDW